MADDIRKNYFLICENVIKDSHSGALSFINVRRQVMSDSFPCTVGGFYVAAGFRPHQSSNLYDNSLHSMLAELKIISPDNKIITDIQQSIPIKRHGQKYPDLDFIFKIGKISVETTGIYRIQLLDLANELILGEGDFEISFPPKPKITRIPEDDIEKLQQRNDIIKKVESSVKCPLCNFEKNFSLCLERDPVKQLEQELLFPENFIYQCENCKKWRLHLGRIFSLMYKKLGQKAPSKRNGYNNA